jgi:manganese transport protein
VNLRRSIRPEPGLVAAAGRRPSARATLPLVLSRGRVRAALVIFGPAFVASVAYVDPGNFATDTQAGSEHGYLLVWVIVLANAIGMLVQYATSKLGLVTQQSLPELCRDHYHTGVNAFLWIQAEVVAMATDVAEVVGGAIGLNLVFGIPLLPAGVITGIVALGVLALQQRGYRYFELIVVTLLSLVGAGLIYLVLAVGRQSYSGFASGLTPRLGGGNALALAIGIVGATVMPHVVYVHSALQTDRITPRNQAEMRTLVRYNGWDCVVGLGVAGVANLVILCVAAAVFHHPGLTGVSQLQAVHARLAALVGGGAALAFGVALIASGLSSATVGTYAGQVVMAGFMKWRVPVLVRRLVTIIPSLAVLAFAANTTNALVYTQIVLAFAIPFALVPLTLLTSRRDVMGPGTNRGLTTGLLWTATVAITVLNVCLLWEAGNRLIG